MSKKFENIGADWLADKVEGMTHEIIRKSPVEYNETTRYLPASVTSTPGYISFEHFPYWREIVDTASPDSDVREVAVLKGVQVGATTALESIMLYVMGELKTYPMMYMTADNDLVKQRVENSILPMLQQSDLGHIIKSADEGNSRKTGKTVNLIQHEGGGYLALFGAKSPSKMRSLSIKYMMRDEIDSWPQEMGKDGNPITLTNDRCTAFWSSRKIYSISTPLEKETSFINKLYLEGDRRKYMVRCKKCNGQQELRWSHGANDGIISGFQWEVQNGQLLEESVYYGCRFCGEPHFEHDKFALFSEENGAEWVPTATPISKGLRSS
jgi:phage terminase large subunit GpA-like protein